MYRLYDLKGTGPVDMKDLIARGSREVDWDPETTSAIAEMIQDIQVARPARDRWSPRRKLLIALPAAMLVAGALTAAGIALVNPPDAIVLIHYTTSDGSHVSCEVDVTATSQPAKQFIKMHDWSDVSRKVQQANLGSPNVAPGAIGSRSRSAFEIITAEIPANLQQDGLFNFALSCK